MIVLLSSLNDPGTLTQTFLIDSKNVHMLTQNVIDQICFDLFFRVSTIFWVDNIFKARKKIGSSKIFSRGNGSVGYGVV